LRNGYCYRADGPILPKSRFERQITGRKRRRGGYSVRHSWKNSVDALAPSTVGLMLPTSGALAPLSPPSLDLPNHPGLPLFAGQRLNVKTFTRNIQSARTPNYKETSRAHQ
jgi:hypothetical protein